MPAKNRHPKRLIQHAKEMRKDPTPSERELWEWLRKKRFCGKRFRRQQPIGPFIVDYYCSDARLIVELDGDSHLEKQHSDEKRSRWLQQQGLMVLRVADVEVFNNLSSVLETIERTIRERLQLKQPTPPPNPLPQGEGEPKVLTVLFDNDGVLVDTERLYYQATRETLASAGVEITLERYIEHSMRLGRNTMELAEPLGYSSDEIERLREKRNQRYSDLIASSRCLLDGVEAAIRKLHGRVSMGIVTGSRRDHFELIHSTTGLLTYFDFHFTREDYVNAKPHPDPYLLAIQKRAIKPEQCVVIEDSPRGCSAAVAAGLRCIVIPTPMTKGCEFPGAHRILNSIAQVPDELLRQTL